MIKGGNMKKGKKKSCTYDFLYSLHVCKYATLVYHNKIRLSIFAQKHYIFSESNNEKRRRTRI